MKYMNVLDMVFIINTIWNYFIQIRQSGIRVKKAKYFPTLVAIVQTPIYGKEKRYITPRECARLQSFPDSFKQAGPLETQKPPRILKMDPSM